MSELTEASSMKLSTIINQAKKTLRGIKLNEYVALIDGGHGWVKEIAISPYWHEAAAGIYRAYVQGLYTDGTTWADWFLFEEMEIA